MKRNDKVHGFSGSIGVFDQSREDGRVRAGSVEGYGCCGIPFTQTKTVVLAAVLSFATPALIHRNECSSAFVNYNRNESPENEVTLKAQRAKNQQIRWATYN
jgi:hypothetical protein